MPLTSTIMVIDDFDRNVTSNYVDFDVSIWEWCSIQITSASGSWSASVLTVQRSNDGMTFYDLESPVGFSAAGISEKIDVSAIAQLRVKLDTKEGSAATSRIVVCCKATV